MYNDCILIFVILLKVFATSGSRVIIGPKYKERHEGSDVKLMWNSTRGLKSATFGISKNGLPNPQFINVNTLSGKVNTNNETAKRFAGRVFFIGNLTVGHAWFVIRNLEINDTNEYIARISVGGSTTKSYVVHLTVQSSSDKGQKGRLLTSSLPTSVRRPITTKTRETVPKITTMPSDNRNNKNVTAAVIAGITAVVTAMILFFIIACIIACICVNSKKGLKRNFPRSETEKSLMSKPKNPEKSDPV